MAANLLISSAARPLGGFFAMTVDTVRLMFRRPFYWREFLQQAWFIASVSILPAIFVAVPFMGSTVFQFTKILVEIGAVDLAGAGAGLAAVRIIGPIAAVLVVASAGATAVCADLGARKVREEIAAMEVLGIDPIHRLVVPRVLATTVVSVFLNGLVTAAGLVAAYFPVVYLQGGTPGLYLSTLDLVAGLPGLVTSTIKAAVFGLLAGLVASYLGLSARAGPKSVGDATNQTVVFSFLLLFGANIIIATVFFQMVK